MAALLRSRRAPPLSLVPPLSSAERRLCRWGLTEGKGEAVLVEGFSFSVTRKELRCLLPGRWANDAVVNFYFRQLQERCSWVPSIARCWFLNSHFLGLLTRDGAYDYSAVRDWSVRQGISVFDLDYIMVPVHSNRSHWALGVVDFSAGGLRYIDSLGQGPPSRFASCLSMSAA